MQRKKRGLAAALLCVLLFAGGCAGKKKVYLAGLETERYMQTEELHTEKSGDAAVSETAEIQSAGDVQSGTQPQTGQISEQSGTKEQLQAGYVYVCGAVKNPGVYPVTADMRVFEAVELAGGFSDDADKQWLNLALPVSDGQRIYVYSCGETSLMEQTEEIALTADSGSVNDDFRTDADSGEPGCQEKINLNTAGREELMTLPGIGEAKADAIIQYRTEYGGFERIEEIQNISGIKSAVFSKIKDYITVQ